MIINNKIYILFCLYFTSVLLAPGLKKIIPYFSFLDEFIFIVLLLLSLNKIKINRLSNYFKKNYLFKYLLIYFILLTIFWNNYEYENILRIKYYIINILFLSLIYININSEILIEKFEKILFILLFVSIFFGIINFIYQNQFLEIFYNNLRSLDISYHNKNARLISLHNNPIIFGFICNIFLVYLIYKSKLSKGLNLILIIITIVLLFFLLVD